MEINLIDILEIEESRGDLIFSFSEDSVLYDPGGEDFEFVSSKGLNYRYQNGRFKMNR